MSTTTPSIGRHIVTTVKVFAIAAGIAVGFSISHQADSGIDTPATAAPTVQFVEPQEDEPGWDCRIHGNDICGPTGGHDAGCYIGGQLVVPWTDDMHGRGEAGCRDGLALIAGS